MKINEDDCIIIKIGNLRVTLNDILFKQYFVVCVFEENVI